jgi:hypothetical protein
MTAAEAQAIAEAFILEKFRRPLSPARTAVPDQFEKDHFVSVFEWTTPEGNRADAPIVVLVSRVSRQARFMT